MTTIFPSPEFDTARPRVSLEGAWGFSYDPDGIGEAQRWYADGHALPEEVLVPGCSQVRHYDSARGNVRVTEVDLPEHSQTIMLKHGCMHPSWWKRTFTVPAEWRGKTIHLHVGGVKPAAEFWLNGQKLGETVTSRSPVRCDLTPYLREGENTLAIRIHWPKYRLDGVYDVWHAWSGIYRGIWIEALPQLSIADIHVIPAIRPAAAKVEIALRGQASRPLRAVVEIAGQDGAPFTGETALASTAALVVPMPGAKLWSPNAPNLYRATVRLYDGEILLDQGSVRSGLREVKVDGDQVLLNGAPIFLRGGCNDHVYPQTVCPPAEVDFFRSVIRKTKAYGYNYTKSACEVFLREFLDAADEEGLLVCQEMPFGMLGELRALRDDPPAEMTDLLRREIANIVTHDRNHPAVAVYSMASEQPLDGDNPAPFHWFSRELPAIARRLNPAALIIDVTAGFCMALDTRHGRRDLDVMEDSLGVREFTLTPLHGPLDIPDTVTVPFLLHEWNWVSSLPDPARAARYADLPLEPVQIPEMIELARKKGVLDELPVMFERSQQLKYALRKDAYELAFEHPKVRGYHGWLLHDIAYCPEGVFNEFWEEPAGLPAEEYRTYNDDTVLVVDDRDRRSFTCGEPVPLGMTVVHFGEEPLRQPLLRWRMVRDGQPIAAGEKRLAPIACGKRATVKSLGIPRLTGDLPAQVELVCELWEGDRKVNWNHWPLWFFPKLRPRACTGLASTLPLPAITPDRQPFDPVVQPAGTRVFVTHRLTDGSHRILDAVIDFIAAGGRVLLLGDGVLEEAESCLYRTVPYNMGFDGNMGTVIRDHPALGDFPHQGWAHFAFIPLISGAYPLRLDPYGKKIHPIIRSNGHHLSMQDKAYLFEIGIGKGVLLASSLKLQPLAATDPAARHLLHNLVRYLAEGEPAPETVLTAEEFKAGIQR